MQLQQYLSISAIISNKQKLTLIFKLPAHTKMSLFPNLFRKIRFWWKKMKRKFESWRFNRWHLKEIISFWYWIGCFHTNPWPFPQSNLFSLNLTSMIVNHTLALDISLRIILYAPNIPFNRKHACIIQKRIFITENCIFPEHFSMVKRR